MFKRNLIFIYGVLSYAVFFGCFLYAIGFVCNVVVPRSMDSAPVINSIQALLVDLGLLSLFALQHSIMARRGFKQWLTRFVPDSAERSTYVLCSSLALAAVFAYWQPLGGVLWHVEGTGALALQIVCGAGWLLVLVSTFLINHFDLFGLRQVWLQFLGRPYRPLPFKTPGFYRFVRHPLYLGWLLAFWAAPTMTVTHLLFSVVTTTYILFAIQLEERDLVRDLGQDYRVYRENVPMLIPGFRAKQVVNADPFRA